MPSPRRKPRFKRVTPRSFRLTERDLAVLRAVHHHRLLDTTHITALVGGSVQNLKRRLQLLYHGKYLDRPRIQIAEFFTKPGSNPIVYGLGARGAETLVDHGAIPTPSASWSAKNRAIRQRFLKHTLLIADVMVAFEVACRERESVRLISWPQLLKAKCPPATQRMRYPQTWRVSLPTTGSVGITPDKIFGLHFLDKPDGRNQAFFFLEADRGTMPVERRSLRQSSLLRKLLVYQQTHQQQLHTERFGIKNFRVLILTTSAKRVRSLVAAARKLTSLQGIFLFAHQEQLAEGSVLHMPWVNGHGEETFLSS